jgi:hypothetical protein
LDRSHHPVLAVVSNCYPEPKGRFPRVTHPCATRPEGLVRLACVRHAASVRSEPESNSQVDVRQAPRGIARSKPASPGAVPAQIYKLVCLRIRTLAPHPSIRSDGYLWNGINLTDHPEPRGSRRPGRRPHVPSSKPTMSKSRHASSPGSNRSGHRLYRQSRGANEGRPRRGPPPLAGAAYMEGPLSRQPPWRDFSRRPAHAARNPGTPAVPR